MARASHDLSMMQMALIGYQSEKEKIQDRIRELRSLLGGRKLPASSPEGGLPKAKRVLSASARERIAAAQRKRWAEHRKGKVAAETSGD